MTKIDWMKIHISTSIIATVTKVGIEMNLDATYVDLEGQGHRSEVKVICVKNVILERYFT